MVEMDTPLLRIEGLRASVGDHEILKGVDLTVERGEVHALMGPNGSGKSTLANVLMGHPGFNVTDGSITFKGEDITAMPPNNRATRGLFLAFQYPEEVPGVSVVQFLRTALEEPGRGGLHGARSSAACHGCDAQPGHGRHLRRPVPQRGLLRW